MFLFFSNAEGTRSIDCSVYRKIGKLKVIPQHFLQGEDMGVHGIRMDIYLDEEDGELFECVCDFYHNL